MFVFIYLFSIYGLHITSTCVLKILNEQFLFFSPQLMSDGKIQQAFTYHDLLTFSQEFKDLVNAHKNIGNPNLLAVTSTPIHSKTSRAIKQYSIEKSSNAKNGDQFIKQEEREKGDTGWKPYLQYLNQKSGYIYLFIGSLSYLIFVICQISQNSWMAANVDNPQVSPLQLITVYFLIGVSSTVFIITRALPATALGIQSSKVLFGQLINSLFHAPMSFYDTTPLGRILSRVSLLNYFYHTYVMDKIIYFD